MNKKKAWIATILLTTFAVWTLLVRCVDVRPIGPGGSSVGFATLNGFVHRVTGVHLPLYTLTDWLGLLPCAVALGFAALGLSQWIRRKSLWRVDHSILALGVFYLTVMVVYLFFEAVVINYRPTLLNGRLEASYPSSTTLLFLCVMPTAGMQLRTRIQSKRLRRCVIAVIAALTAFTVVGRLLSGVHWLSDIVGGALFSAGLVTMYAAFEKHTT